MTQTEQTAAGVVDSHNPLLNLGFKIPFDQIQPEHAEPAVDLLIARSREDLERLAQAPSASSRVFCTTLTCSGSSSWRCRWWSTTSTR